MQDTLNLTAESFKELKRLYATAQKENTEFFEFQGKELYTLYAKYLIQYIESTGKFNHDQQHRKN